MQPVLPKKFDGTKWKILYYGDLGASTGFNTVSRNILSNLHKTDMFDITVLAVNNWGEPDPDQAKYKIYPAANNPNKDPYGAVRFQQMLMEKNQDFDFVFVLQDSFVIAPYIEELFEKSRGVVGKKYVSFLYFPIDGTPKKEWVRAASSFDCPVTYTKFAYEECVKAFPPIAQKLQAIPHGINTEEFFPLPKEYAMDFRREVFSSIPDINKKFLFFRIDRNQPRKDYPRLLIAFKEFLRRNPESAVLYCHCMPSDPMGHDLYEISTNLGLRPNIDVCFPDSFDVKTGYPVQIINKIYSLADCYITNTLGGGWELCTNECFATKTPIIAPRNTALTEIIGANEERGYLVDSGNNINNHIGLIKDSGVIRPLTDLEDMVRKMEHVYRNPEEVAKKVENAYDWVTKNYSWDTGIMPKWYSLFAQAATMLNVQKYSVKKSNKKVVKSFIL